MVKFKSVSSQVDFPSLERELLDYWYKQGIVEKYLKRNEKSDKKFSFLDGPITANNPMGVHHAWGRTYKDLWQRFFNMKGFRQRFQNGFDEQGLWVEVEVEKELGLKSKKDIENLVSGDKFKSLEKFINLCKERVKKYSAIQTKQSKRLGYFMNWDNSYHTSSDENNYAIWNYLKVVNGKGWLYKGRDSVPWCPRCGTAISQHEILTEEYQEITHDSVFIRAPILTAGGFEPLPTPGDKKMKQYLLVWTTTPWTLPGNVYLAVHPDKEYALVEFNGEGYWLMDVAVRRLFDSSAKVIQKEKGYLLVEGGGWEYSWPFDDIPIVARVKKSDPFKAFHHVIPAKDLVTEEEGTGIVHIAPGAGTEDFRLMFDRKEYPELLIPLIEEDASYLPDLGVLAGKNAKNNPELILNYLKNKEVGKYLFKFEPYSHRYPTCWRCKTELVWRVVDEWYVAMDRKDESGKTYRQQMIDVAKKINWIPKWGLERELDWLKNMHDWLISKKRYWGLSLPIWECSKCGNFEVIGGKEELKEKACQGWDMFEGNSPHRPWIDQVRIKCSKCEEIVPRIPDVGNPWLDAGIVPFSTMPKDWFPADFVTEGFPGQFKNWFYSLIAMSTALKNENPFKNLLGFANVVDEKGEEMHKSKGNAIEFNEAADKIGVDVMRWLYVTQNPEYNLLFGYTVTDEIRRRFYLILWNSYKFFVDYANLANWSTSEEPPSTSLGTSKPTFEVSSSTTLLDKWILAKMTTLILLVDEKLEKYDATSASRAIEDFVVNDFSTWYIRRSRERVGPEADQKDLNAALSVMYDVLVTCAKLVAPFMPFISEEMYKNLTGEDSVHLQDYPLGDKSLLNDQLVKDMAVVRKVVEAAHAKRKEERIKLRQPLSSLTYKLSQKLDGEMEQILADELNVKSVEYKKSADKKLRVVLDTKITPKLKEEGEARELIRAIQQSRKEQNLTLKNKTKIIAPSWPVAYEEQILQGTASISIVKGDEFKVVKVD